MDVNTSNRSGYQSILPRQGVGSQKAPTLHAERFLNQQWSRPSSPSSGNFSFHFQNLIQQLLNQLFGGKPSYPVGGPEGPKGPKAEPWESGNPGAQLHYGGIRPPEPPVAVPLYGAIVGPEELGPEGPKGPEETKPWGKGGGLQPVYGSIVPIGPEEPGPEGPKGPKETKPWGKGPEIQPIYGAIVPADPEVKPYKP